MKVTKEVYTKVKQNRLVTELSKRTINNIKKTKNYTEYRKKYAEVRRTKASNDFITSLITQHEIDMKQDFALYCGLISKDINTISKLLIYYLIIMVIGFSVLIALIAW